jgi:hypothetical protein
MTDPVALLGREKVVDVEARTKGGRTIRVPIWIVVIDGVPYVASVRGEKGQWYRALRAAGEGTLYVKDRAIAVRARHVDTAETRAAMSAALAKKYRSSAGSLRRMQQPDALATILRLELV